MAALGAFAPGNYSMTYDTGDVGIIAGDGEMLRLRTEEKPVKGTVPFGDTKIDGIYRGLNGLLLVTFKEWTTPVKKAIFPWYSGGLDGRIGTIGQLGSSVAKQVVLTAESGSPAYTVGPRVVTIPLCKLAPENDINILFGPAERDIPVIFELLPYKDGSNFYRLFSVTEPS